MKWSKNKFSNAKKRIEWLKNELQDLMNCTGISQDNEAVKKITQEREKL